MHHFEREESKISVSKIYVIEADNMKLFLLPSDFESP